MSEMNHKRGSYELRGWECKIPMCLCETVRVLLLKMWDAVMFAMSINGRFGFPCRLFLLKRETTYLSTCWGIQCGNNITVQYIIRRDKMIIFYKKWPIIHFWFWVSRVDINVSILLQIKVPKTTSGKSGVLLLLPFRLSHRKFQSSSA